MTAVAPLGEHRAPWLVPLACIAALNLACLPLRDFWYPDEPDIARVTLGMVQRGDFLQPYLYDKPFDDYPPLFFWIATVFGRIGHWSEFALRLPTMLSGLGLLAALGEWARRRFDARVAAWTVLVLGTAYQFHWQSINMHLDMLLALSVGCAVLSFDLASTSSTRGGRWSWYAASALAMGAASLTKGPVGLLIPGAVLGLDAALAREWKRWIPLALCGVVGAAMFMAWAAAFSAHAGGEGVIYFLTKQNLDRFRGGRSHEHAFPYYLGTIWMDLAPWSLLLVPALVHAWRCARRGERAARLALIWFGFGFVFFSAAASKRSVYLLPILPAAGLLVAHYVSACIDGLAIAGRWARAQVWGVGAVLALAGLALPAGIPWVLKHTDDATLHIVVIAAVAAALLVMGVWYLLVVRRAPLARAWGLLPFVVAGSYVVMHGILLPSLDDPLSGKPDAKWLAGQLDTHAGEELAVFRTGRGELPKESTTLEFYGRFGMRVVTQPDELAHFTATPGDILLVKDTDRAALERTANHPFDVARVVMIGDDEFEAVRAAPPR